MTMAQRSSSLRYWWPDVLTAIGLLVAPYVLPSLGFSRIR